jgi:ribosomal protein S18 acetylase RimI-like enzyme
VAVDGNGRALGAVLVTSRATPGGVLANMDVTGSPEVTPDLVEWARRFSQAAGAFCVQLFAASGYSSDLARLGFHKARPWWRMDRSLHTPLPPVEPVDGYELVDARTPRPGAWGYLHNRSFADHWRFAPRSEEEMISGKVPELCLMTVTAAESAPAAVTIGLIERYAADTRPQPVGLVSSVGTTPEHRRRGLAKWLVAELLERLRRTGAAHASLYVDGWNETGAPAAYRKLGFELAFDAEVWEADLA